MNEPQIAKSKRTLYRIIFTKNMLIPVKEDDKGNIIWDTNRYGEMGQWLCCTEPHDVKRRYESPMFEVNLKDKGLVDCRAALKELLNIVGLDLTSEEQDELVKHIHFQGTFLIYH